MLSGVSSGVECPHTPICGPNLCGLAQEYFDELRSKERLMTDRQDPELMALAAVLKAISDLDRNAQQRVLRYAGERLQVKSEILDDKEFLESITKGLAAINQAAMQLNHQEGPKVSGLQLASVIAQAYEDAVAASKDNTDA